jgi:transcriptional regulator with XRE-family HTH domain
MKNRNAAKAPTKDDVYIGARIREARIASGMTQTELGGLLGVSYQQVQKYEEGKNRINGARIELLITALNRPFSYFYPNATDVRATADPDLVAMLTSKEGQEVARGFSRLSARRDRRLVRDLIEVLSSKEQTDG